MAEVHHAVTESRPVAIQDSEDQLKFIEDCFDVLKRDLSAFENAMEDPDKSVEDLRAIARPTVTRFKNSLTVFDTHLRELRKKLDEVEDLEELDRQSIAVLDTLTEELQKAYRDLEIKNRELAYAADHDPLTGAYNRRVIMEMLEREISRCERGGPSFCIILVDLDHFKGVNDTYGHSAGDEILKALVTALKNSIRKIDVTGRYGGEEFLLILPRTGLEGATQFAIRLLNTVREIAVEHEDKVIKVTASFGIADYQPNGDRLSSKKLLIRADQALYNAKNSGRNCFKIWEPSMRGFK